MDNYLKTLVTGFAYGVISLQREIDSFQLNDMWHGFSQDIDINFYTDDFGKVHATAYEIDVEGNQKEPIELF